MKSKLILLSLSMVLAVSLLAGCSSKAPATNSDAAKTTAVAKTDTVSGASQATDEASFENKISKNGNYIIITSKDLTFTKDLTVDGNFTKKGKDGKDVVARSLAFASKSADGKTVDKRFTVTVPRIVINSENTLLEDGIIKGDVYVQAKGFTTLDATINGNLYFATDDLKNAFCADAKTKITGNVEVKQYTK